MSETKHTPGPWHWYKARKLQYLHAEGGNPLGVTMPLPGHESYPISAGESCEANARLIAAAPDLLAACERMAAWIKENGNTIQIGTNEAVDPWPELDRLMAEIRKAKGE